jgi:signal-transduction protein with cAMP-binding, CBS, and nucleotidyltransferase domain
MDGVKVRDVMTPDPLTMEEQSSVRDAAIAMTGADVGPVIVIDKDKNVTGILTDRDIVVRVVARGLDPANTSVGDVSSRDLAMVTPDDDTAHAVQIMRSLAIRRLPVLEGTKAAGIVSIGDLAIERDPASALAGISGAAPNK